MVSSILTPGTIFLLILGAINMAYPSIDLWVALIINLLPVTVMVVLCFISTSQVQVTKVCLCYLINNWYLFSYVIGVN